MGSSLLNKDKDGPLEQNHVYLPLCGLEEAYHIIGVVKIFSIRTLTPRQACTVLYSYLTILKLNC